MNSESSERFLTRIRSAAERIGRPARVMEVCGTHTMAVARAGLRGVFPSNVELVSGPGCPVCVTPQSDIERILFLARQPEITLCTFGDMLRVPGVESSLECERSTGADVRVVYSPLDALRLAEKESARECVFIAVGFETTAPGIAATALMAHEKRIRNFSLYISHKLIPPAMEAVMDGDSRIDGFLTPGHVSVILGAEAYTPAAGHYSVPCVATGFNPLDILEGMALVLERIGQGNSESIVQYTRAVKPGGNPRAREILYRVFEPADAEWRGLGTIPQSGLKLRAEYDALGAAGRFEIPDMAPVELPGCMCGDVLKGIIHPPDCPLFGTACTPRTPVGPCMVSTEGSCAARYKYG